MRKKQLQFSEFYENERVDRDNELEYMRGARKELDDELFQERTQQ